jgi:uncharacterized protein DUF1707
MTPNEPSDGSLMRASDADRDRAVSILNDALADGRLTAEEHSERLDAIFAAKTHADIAPLVSDLAGGTVAVAALGEPAVRGRGGSKARMVSVLSGISRTGAWQVPAEIRAVNVLGSTDLDLREAVLPAREITIRSVSILGGVQITVPPEMHVIDDGWALMGGREMPPDTAESAGQNATVLRLRGISILGGMTVRTGSGPGLGPGPGSGSGSVLEP